MVTTIYLIRHGATEGSEIKGYKGSLDVPLSGRGREQMRGSAAFVARHAAKTAALQASSYLHDVHGTASPDGPPARLAAVYCSDLSRAAASAEIIAEPHGIQPIPVAALRERSFGIWEGMTFAAIRAHYPSEFGNWSSDPLAFSPPGGETTLSVAGRAGAALDRISADHKGQQIAVVAHGGVNRVLLCSLFGIPLNNLFRIEQGYGCVNIIELWDRYPVLRLMNGACHE